MKKKLNKIRIAILKVITFIAGISFVMSVSALDGVEITIPVIVMLVSGLWLALIGIANS